MNSLTENANSRKQHYVVQKQEEETKKKISFFPEMKQCMKHHHGIYEMIILKMLTKASSTIRS